MESRPTLQHEEKTVGVIGGLGPQATADFFNRVIHNTAAGIEQDHLHILIDNNPKVPNRNHAVAGTGPSPARDLADSARRLEQAGADFLVMPCNTAHAFQEAITSATSIPFLSIVDATCEYIKENHSEVETFGLLAADGCRQAKLYESAALAMDMEMIQLPLKRQEEFMQLVYLIKATGVTDQVRVSMREMASGLLSLGAELIVGGCTEVPLSLSPSDLPVPLVDTTEILAKRCVSYARGEDLTERT